MAEQKLSTEEKIAEKRERVPVHESRDKLTTRGLDKENFYYRFINTTDPDRVDRFLRAGYEFVAKGGGRVGHEVVDSADGMSSVITVNGGLGVTLALVCLPMELWLEDQAAKEKVLKEQEADMRRELTAQTDPRLGIDQGVENLRSGHNTPGKRV